MISENIILKDFAGGGAQSLLLIKEVPIVAVEVKESVFSFNIRLLLKHVYTKVYNVWSCQYNWMNYDMITHFWANVPPGKVRKSEVSDISKVYRRGTLN